MRNLAAALLLGLGACSYTDPNPWDTSGDMDEYREKTEENWQYELREPARVPQSPPAAFENIDLEGWRDTVLANADPTTLKHIRTWTLHKLEWLKAEITRWYRTDPYNRRVALSELQNQYGVEQARLRLVEAREAQVAR